MLEFVRHYADAVTGVLSGFDRILFRGTLRTLMYVNGMMGYLYGARVLLKDFDTHVRKVTGQVRAACEAVAQRQRRPVIYLPSPRESKEDRARQIAEADHVQSGLICIFKSIEPCFSYEVHRNRKEKELQLKAKERKCLHYYQYWMHPQMGLMHARIQTWFPFTIQACLNGREWLARMLEKEGVAYVKQDNCFTWLDDVQRAQEVFNLQLKTDWCTVLDALARQLNPAHDQIFARYPHRYYWTAAQTEWATDVMFKNDAALGSVYPYLVRKAIQSFGALDVLRFLGRRATTERYLLNTQAEVTSNLKRRPEGLRIRHTVDRNSVKMYDKQGSVLRVETTIDNPNGFYVYRSPEGRPETDQDWLPLRKGIADLHRRTQISQACNKRYLDKLACLEETKPLSECVDRICQPVRRKGKRVRALNPWGQDAQLLALLLRGEYDINGFRNRDLRQHLYTVPAANKREARRRSSRVSRLLNILRAHRLIRKVPRTHRYMLTQSGRTTLMALSAAHNANARKLLEAA